MDKIQAKMVELIDALPALEVCLSIDKIGYPDLIMYLQYDVPLESNCELLTKLKRSLCKKDYYDLRYSMQERKGVLKQILTGVQEYIIECDINDSKAQIVFKEAADIAKQICSYLDKPKCASIHPVPYCPEKAAM